MKAPLVSRRSMIGGLSQSPSQYPNVRRFHGGTKTDSHWDGLRRDTELWAEDADCLVHFYGAGASQRGPSLRVPIANIEAAGSTHLLDRCIDVRQGRTSANGSPSSFRSDTACHELFLPAPATLQREQAYAYHLTTRNFFAFISSKPLVGEHLGVSLADLLQRVRQWQPRHAALANLMQYCHAQGYLDMAGNPDYALACLVLAERAQLGELWIEAFTHSTGMRDQLSSSPEYVSLSNTTKALITRASLEMELHTTRVIRALGIFLEEELGPEQVGLSKPARDHLDRFRSCLNNHYVNKLGYFPPSAEGPWNKRLWTKMYHSFHSLYRYLADTESTNDPNSLRGMDGGLCVVQNIRNFDQKHGYTSLPHPLPLLPEQVAPVTDTTKSLRKLGLGKRDAHSDRQPTARQLLRRASNQQHLATPACALVEEYQRFEQQKLEEKLSIAEARKVRWLLIYGVLQMLISITRAPPEVRDTETPVYPLCVLTAGMPKWATAPGVDTPQSPSTSGPDMTSLRTSDLHGWRQHKEEKKASVVTFEEDVETISIHPDCEADTAEDFFASQRTVSRPDSAMDARLTPAPLRISTQFSRRESLRSSVHALQKSVRGSLAKRHSRQAPPPPMLPRTSSYCEIIVDGYGNGQGVHEALSAAHPASQSSPDLHRLDVSYPDSPELNPLAAFDFGLAHDLTVESLDDMYSEPDDLPGLTSEMQRVQSDSGLSSTLDSAVGSSNRSSSFWDVDTPITPLSALDSDAIHVRHLSDSSFLSPIDSPSPIDIYAIPNNNPFTHQSPSYGRKHLNFGVKPASGNVNAGCYTPSGLVLGPAKSKFANSPITLATIRRDVSADSVRSASSSIYPEGGSSTQASDIAEEEYRGRKMTRALDRLSLEELYEAGKVLNFEMTRG